MLHGQPYRRLGLRFCGRIRPQDEGAFVKDWRASVAKKPSHLRKGPTGVQSLLQATGKLGIPDAQVSHWGRMSGRDRVR